MFLYDIHIKNLNILKYNMLNKIPIITIDGPSGVGKSTLSKILANQLNWSILESGKIYRLVACLALHKNLEISEKNLIPIAKNLDYLVDKKKYEWFFQFMDQKLISDISSKLATYSYIRNILLKKQRSLLFSKGLIAEGRDMGTVVFPNAILKFYLNANLFIRVKRRILELNKNGYHINFADLLIQMKNRDIRDKNRRISPLCIPKNAIILDSTYMSITEVIQTFMKHIVKKITI